MLLVRVVLPAEAQGKGKPSHRKQDVIRQLGELNVEITPFLHYRPGDETILVNHRNDYSWSPPAMCTPPTASLFCSVRYEEAKGAHDGHRERAGEKTRESLLLFNCREWFRSSRNRNATWFLMYSPGLESVSGKYSQARKWVSRSWRNGPKVVCRERQCWTLLWFSKQSGKCIYIKRTVCLRGKYNYLQWCAPDGSIFVAFWAV